MSKRALAVLPAAVVMALSGSGAAWAGPVANFSEGTADTTSIAGIVSLSGDTAKVSFVHECIGDARAVWASVKQLEDPSATADWDFDTHGTSSRPASARSSSASRRAGGRHMTGFAAFDDWVDVKQE